MKKFLLSLSLIFFSFCLFAQSDNDFFEEKQSFTQSANFLEFINSLDLVIQMEPGMYMNTASKLVSAPSPVIYPISIGILWPNYTYLAMQPTVSFFMMNHLWYDDMALPAEIENRTGTTLNFMISFPAVLSFHTKKSRLQIMPGFSILARYSLLANNVAADDSGYSGSAGDDISEINKWFWKNGNFFYLTGGAAWIFNFHNNAKAGPVFNLYIPIGSIINKDGINGLIVTTGLKISL